MAGEAKHLLSFHSRRDEEAGVVRAYIRCVGDREGVEVGTIALSILAANPEAFGEWVEIFKRSMERMMQVAGVQQVKWVDTKPHERN